MREIRRRFRSGWKSQRRQHAKKMRAARQSMQRTDAERRVRMQVRAFTVMIFVPMVDVKVNVPVAAVFVLRSREPNAPRPFKALGYPWTPAIFVLVSAAIVVNAFFSDPRVSLTGTLIILAGIPLYYFFTRRSATTG